MPSISSQPTPAMPPTTAPAEKPPVVSKPSSTSEAVTQEEITWATQLESKVREGHYQPNAEEMDKYTEIYQKLQSNGISETASEASACSPQSHKGILDYPKDMAMSVTQFMETGRAKNQMEFLEDIGDIKDNGKKLVENVKEGKLLKATGNLFKMGWNGLSAGVNSVQSGAYSMAAGASAVVSIPLNLLDKGAEAAGKAMSDSGSSLVRGTGKVFQALGGENSHQGFFEAVNEATQKGITKAQAD